ncbi:MAG: TRAP transporter small permease subunit [Bacteriovoracaceae bacterium]|jgi:TRAP-type C4-dicarboxylate transport system permease small subunit|nr:TRAP transporter small permease subunit [Bacteriovoracaceae bacterium]
MSFFKAIDNALERFAYYTLVICITLMVLLTLLGIGSRQFSTTFLWLDPLVRHLVFLSAFMGGVLATGKRGHIGIDIIGKFLESKGLCYFRDSILRVVDLAAFITVMWLSYWAIQLSKIEFQYGREIFLGVHSGYLVSIIPFGLILIGYRFFFLFISSIKKNVDREGEN